MSNNTDPLTFEDLEATDVITVELVPERKGLILKHCEYYVSSRRHGTTVTRRFNEFAQLYDVLYAKYPYRAVCRLPPKRMVVGGGSPLFLQRRRAALQRWLTLVARHPVLAHDADLRTFLCETTVRLDKPKHDEFMLAGSQEDIPRDMTTEDMQAAFVCEQEQLRLIQLGLGRLFKICEKVESRSEAERADIRELGAGLNALSAPVAADSPRWSHVKESLRAAAQLATEMGEARNGIEEAEFTEEGAGGRVQLALEALGAFRELCARLTRGLHAERAAAAAHAPHSPAAHALRLRHGYALRAALEEARVGRAYALGALESLPELFGAHGEMRARAAALWSALNAALAPTPARAHQPRLYRGPVHGHS
ncbi:sorting nexin-8 isoform X1 [Achroia grisella]|uniref:sorting nexin-8 isoform X1 n=1 Tax=Achroia grisella TaxID=688607 RepID=UPI0027D2C455|nr:sorting nexin-8 isoform X1 [Achroia grisella]